MINGVIFDMDGLMFDTERLAVQGWIYAGKQAGIDITEELVMRTLGLNIENTRRVFIERFGEQFDFYAHRQARLGHLKRYLDTYGVPVKPGLFELLDFLKREKIKTTVATSTDRPQAMELFIKAGVDGYFDDFISGDMIKRGKPEPDIYLSACALIDEAPENCMALEDSFAGIWSAHRAGMKPVIVPDLIAPDETITGLLYARVDTLSDVAGLIKTQNA